MRPPAVFVALLSAGAAACLSTPPAVDPAPDAHPAELDGRVIGLDAVDGAPEQSCVEGAAHLASPGSCAEQVCAQDASCCATAWTGSCVLRAESLCATGCATLAFVGGAKLDPAGKSGLVMNTIDHEILWSADETEAATNAAAWADYDGDGDADLATAGQDVMRIYRNDGLVDGALVLLPVFIARWSELHPGQVFDGRDVRWVRLTPEGRFSVLFLGYGGMARADDLGSGFSTPRVLIEGSEPNDPQLWEVAVGDTNGDGYPEVATAHWEQRPRFFRNDNGVLVNSGWVGASTSNSGLGAEFCNLDADPTPELVLTSWPSGNSGGGIVAIHDVDVETNLPVAEAAKSFPGYLFPRQVRCADLDGDGFQDLFLAQWGAAPAHALRGHGSLGEITDEWTEVAAAPSTFTEGAWSVELGDVDGDGKIDAFISGNGYIAGTTSTTMFLTFYRNTTQPGGLITFDVARVDSGGILQVTRNIKLAPTPALAP